MSAPASRAAQALRRATSRTRTARAPLAKPLARWVFGFEPTSFDELYAGAPDLPPQSAQFPGHTANLPFADAALQVHARSTRQLSFVLLLVDLGENRDLARIELFGNPLLPPDARGGRPLHNFGLPGTIGMAVREQPFRLQDLHRRTQPGNFYRDFATDWGIRWLAQDLRALWGWTPLHLPATFGRYLMFAFADLPELPGKNGTAKHWGVDIQRMVFFPFLEGVDHEPHVEHSIVSSRQQLFVAPSDYWSHVGTSAPTADTSQSLAFDPSGDVLRLPSALCGIPDRSPIAGDVPVYASDLVPTDTSVDNRILLVTQATTDEIPMLAALRLVFPLTRQGPEYGDSILSPRPGYLMSVCVTNDLAAAFSADPAHPSWRLVAEPRLVNSARMPLAQIDFVEPVQARWVRLTARPVTPDKALARLALRSLELVRPRDWSFSPEPEDDVQVEALTIRLRGEHLLDDYAFFDGQHSVDVTVELRQDGGAPQELRSFRSLLDLVEETHHRVFANSRRVERPVQRYSETSTVHSDTASTSDTQSNGRSTATVLPEFHNRQVVRSGSLTDYVPRPRNFLGATHFTSLPNVDATGLTTTRSFEVDLNALTLPQIDPTNTSIDQIVSSVVSWAGQLSAQGAPVSLGIGGNLGGNLGVAAGVTVGGSLGFSVNAGSQVGGGVTKSNVSGNQGSVTRSEMCTIESEATQASVATSHATSQLSADVRDQRQVERVDQSEDVRRTGMEVQYGGRKEDIIIVSIPINRLLRGSPWMSTDSPPRPLVSRDELRVRIEHLPPGVTMDVEFRGRVTPRQRGD